MGSVFNHVVHMLLLLFSLAVSGSNVVSVFYDDIRTGILVELLVTEIRL